VNVYLLMVSKAKETVVTADLQSRNRGGALRNAESPMKVALGGISIDFNRLESNTDASIRASREPLSKTTVSSIVQQRKHLLPRRITEDGISIDVNPLSEKADSSIRSSREPFSNVTDLNQRHARKLDFPKTTTEDGMTTESRKPR
jgi:hypothetical protein